MQIPDINIGKSPFRRNEPKSEGRGFRRLEKLVRLVALLLLCGLVWYFSYDHGRSDTATKNSRIELENYSLREKLILAEEDLKATREELALLKESLAQGQGNQDAAQKAAQAPSQNPTGPSLDPSPPDQSPAGQAPSQSPPGQSPAGQSPQSAGQAESDGRDLALEARVPRAPESLDEPSPARVGPGQNRERFTLRAMENKAAYNGQAVLSLVDLNSLDREVTVRIRYADSGRREARVMVPGDLVNFQLGDGTHSLYLDQIRGNMAFFILDGLPIPTSGDPF